MVTGELSKDAQPGTCVYTAPALKELEGLARLSIWQGCCLTPAPIPKEPLDQDSQQRWNLPVFVFLCQYLAASSRSHHCGCLASRTLKWIGQKICFASTAKEKTGKRCRTETPPQLSGKCSVQAARPQVLCLGCSLLPSADLLEENCDYFAKYFFSVGSVFLQEFLVRPAEHRKHYWIRGCLNWCCFSEENSWLLLSSLRVHLALER